MPMMAIPAPTVVIARDECLRLLAAEAVGRVVFTTAAMPAAQPVAFLIDRGDIVFRAHGPLGAARREVVAFEANNIDPHTFTGWSVLGIGETYEIHDSVRLAELVDLQRHCWGRCHSRLLSSPSSSATSPDAAPKASTRPRT